MKKGIIFTLAAVVLIIFVASSFKPQGNDAVDLVIIRTVESDTRAKTPLLLTISDNNGTVIDEKKSLRFEDRSDVMFKVLKSYYSKGYDLVESTRGGADALLFTTYILKKE